MTRQSSPDGGTGRARATVPDGIARLVVGEQTLAEVLRLVAEEALVHVPAADQVSVTLLDRDGRCTSVAFTGDLAVALDERQYETGFGPCVDAAQSGSTISVFDTSEPDPLYPDYSALARRHGVTSSVSSGLTAQHVMGGVNVYCLGEKRADEETVRLTQEYAELVTAAVANAALHTKAVDELEQIRAAMASRAVIEQAKGVLVALRGCTPDEAFRHLARTSQNANRKLRDEAADLVGTAAGGNLEGGGSTR